LLQQNGNAYFAHPKSVVFEWRFKGGTNGSHLENPPPFIWW